MAADKLESIVVRLENVTQKLERIGSKGGSGDAAEFIPPFEQLIAGTISKFVKLSESISPDVKNSASLLNEGFQVSLEILKVVAVSKKPSDSEIGGILKPLSDKIAEIKGFADKNYKSEFRSHLEAVGAISAGLGWFPAPMKPQNFVKDSIDSGMFYTNRVLTSFKDKGAQHKNWVQALIQCFKDLQQYVEDYHSTGCCWNVGGKTASPPAAVSTKPASSTASAAPGPSPVNLLADINKGVGITGGLKKVDDSMKTHKNPNLRAGNTVTDKPTTEKATSKSRTQEVDKPPVLELQGKKWLIGYQKDQEMITIDKGDITFVSQIWNCKKSNAKFTTKLNTLSIENCLDCKFQFTSGLIGVCDVINSRKISIYVDEEIPTISINNSDDCQIYLSPKSLNTCVTTAKSANVNVCLCTENDEKELNIPSQFISRVVNGKLVTEPTENI